MATPFDEIDPFFWPGEAQSATWTPVSGSPVVGLVWLDRPDEMALDDVMAADHAVTYRVAQWPTVRSGDQVTIAAVTYTVRGAPMRLDDGLVARANLKRL